MAPPARPRDKGGTWPDAAAKEYASSNSTSAKFLGGFQKPWMTGQSDSTIGQTGTGPSRPITGQQNLARLQETILNQQALNPSTTSQSDTIFNIHQSTRCPGRQYQKDPEAVLPSPAPSDEHRPEKVQPFEFEIDGQAPNIPTSQTQNSSSSGLAYRNGEIEGWNNRQQNTVSKMTPPSSNATLPHDPHAPAEFSGPSAAVLGTTKGTLEKKRKRPAPRAIMVRSDDLPLEVSPSSSHSVDPCTPSSNEHSPSNDYMRSLVSAVVIREQTVAARNNTRSGTELARLSLLQKACAQHDHVYLLLHQIYCMYPRRLNYNHQLTGAGFQGQHFKGLAMLNSLLLSNPQVLDNDAIDWFAVFPSPFENQLRSFPIYREALEYIKIFLAKFAQHWRSFQDACTKRRSPPFTDEQFTVLGLGSPTLQTVVFRAMHRNVWIGAIDDPCFEEGERLFHENQHMLRQRSTPLSDAEKLADYQTLMNDYRRIQVHHERHLQGNSSSDEAHVSSMQPTPISPPPVNGQGRLHRTQQAGPMNTSFNHVGNPLGPNVNTQHTRHVSARITNRTPPVVPSPPFSSERGHSSTLRESPITSSASPAIISPSIGSETSQAGELGNGGSYPMSLPRSNTSDQHQALIRDPRSTIGPRSPNGAYSDRNGVIHAKPLNGLPSNAQAGTLATGPHTEQSTRFNRLRQPQAPGSNVPPSAMYGQLLLPVSGQNLLTVAHPNPMLTALHQYRARSPVLTARDGSNLEKNGMKYFQHVREVRVLDDRLRMGYRQHLEWNFGIKEADFRLLCGALEVQDGLFPRRAVEAGSESCRVRCIDASKLPGAICERDWVVARQIWPPNITVVLNDKPLDIRKKIHYGKDLPVDITPLIHQGTNTLSVSIIRAQKENNTEYAIGVEWIRLLNQKAAKALTRVLPYDKARQRILQRFRNSDPDIEVVDASITLDVTDPHTCRIWDVPMRSTTCLHDQCFDLDTFLQTRRGNRAGQPCDPDQFKCPICDADARPQSLIKDEFFVVLRGMLAKQNRLDAKAIIMKQDGSWQIKEEEKTGEGGDGAGRLSCVGGGGAVSTDVKGIIARREIETVEIEDD
ncbi:MAG: hypothetical protein LQ343_003906 [Gyalolechia ehrenbergii]|nr:MAG: hypothetical protein LQ343_003906 [Gyalolechia ehrenbergii]